MRRQCDSARSSRRTGFTLVELIATAAVLAALTLLTGPLLLMGARQQREAGREQLALLELGNIMERLAATAAAGELTAEVVETQKLSDATAQQLPGAELKAKYESASGEQGTARVTLEIAWTSGDGRSRPARLSAWFRPGRAAP